MPSTSLISTLPRIVSTSGGKASVSIVTATSGLARSARRRPAACRTCGAARKVGIANTSPVQWSDVALQQAEVSLLQRHRIGARLATAVLGHDSPTRRTPRAFAPGRRDRLSVTARRSRSSVGGGGRVLRAPGGAVDLERY